jgi:hypothetical protein
VVAAVPDLAGGKISFWWESSEWVWGKSKRIELLFVVGDLLGGSSSFEVKSSSTLVVWIATVAVDLGQYKL